MTMPCHKRPESGGSKKPCRPAVVVHVRHRVDRVLHLITIIFISMLVITVIDVVVQGKNIKLDQETNSTASLKVTNCQIKIFENAAENHLVVHDRIHKHCHAVFGQNLVLRVLIMLV